MDTHQLSSDRKPATQNELAVYRAEIAALKALLDGKDREIDALHETLLQREHTITRLNEDRRELVDSVSQKLCHKYSKMHLQKVRALKARYQRALQKERTEKAELVKTYDTYVEMMQR